MQGGFCAFQTAATQVQSEWAVLCLCLKGGKLNNNTSANGYWKTLPAFNHGWYFPTA